MRVEVRVHKYIRPHHYFQVLDQLGGGTSDHLLTYMSRLFQAQYRVNLSPRPVEGILIT